MRPLVSVVMPVHNGELFLEAAIESIRGQTFADFELVVVDDGSTDRTGELLAQAAKRDARIRVVAQEKGGIVRALNRGVAASSGEWIARMDADDVSLPRRLERQVAHVRASAKVAALGGDCTVIDERGAELSTRRFPSTHALAMRAMEAGGLAFPHPTALIRRSMFDQVGGYRERFRHAEDVDLWLRLSELGEIRSIGEIVLQLRKHASNVSLFSGGKFQLRGDYAARIAHFRRIAGYSDPASFAEPEWNDFVAWLESRLVRTARGEEWMREVLRARARGLRGRDVSLAFDSRAPAALVRHFAKRACLDFSAKRLARESLLKFDRASGPDGAPA